MKAYLQSYRAEELQALNSLGTTFILEGFTVSFFGLIRRKIKVKYTIPDFHNPQTYFDHWDKLIESKKPFK